jgi:hypothetical protein
MNREVKDLLIEQRKHFMERLLPALDEVAELQKKLQVQNDAVRVLQMSIEQVDAAIDAINKTEAKSTSARPRIMQVVLEILERAPNGMTAREIMKEINSRAILGKPIQRHSLSPQLSRLKDRDKKIELRGDRWYRLPAEPTLFAPKK